MSTSCSALKKYGVFKSGFYNIKSEEDISIKTVFCDMESGTYDDVPETNVMNYAPIGTILPWVPKPEKNESVTSLDVPEGWQKCDGSLIPAPSVWAGQKTPDLNNERRFLRGSPDDSILTFEDDQLQDHHHDISDPGHEHDYSDYYITSYGDII